MNESELFTLKENYANHIIDGMDVDSLAQMAYDLLLDAYQDCTEDEMIEEIKDLYDEDTLISLLPDAEVAQGSWHTAETILNWFHQVGVKHPTQNTSLFLHSIS